VQEAEEVRAEPSHASNKARTGKRGDHSIRIRIIPYAEKQWKPPSKKKKKQPPSKKGKIGREIRTSQKRKGRICKIDKDYIFRVRDFRPS
jgi:hypothetical protein